MKKNLTNRKKLEFVGVAFDICSIDDTVSIAKNRNSHEAFGYIVTPNVDHVVRMHSFRDRYSPLYKNAWLCLCDSKILYILARFSGLALTVVPGSDLTKRLFSDAINKGDKVCVIGGDVNVVDMLGEIVGVDALAHYNPPMGFVNDPAEINKCVDFVIQHPSRYIFFAVGSPQQEIVAMAVRKTGAATGIGFCIGASIDFLTGKEHRAPEWMQKIGLEWLFRLLQDPKRMWRRYLLHGPRIFIIYLNWLLPAGSRSGTERR